MAFPINHELLPYVSSNARLSVRLVRYSAATRLAFTSKGVWYCIVFIALRGLFCERRSYSSCHRGDGVGGFGREATKGCSLVVLGIRAFINSSIRSCSSSVSGES